MMLCPRCKAVHKRISRSYICKCDNKTKSIYINDECVVGIALRLHDRGLCVYEIVCDVLPGSMIQLLICFGEEYPNKMFAELPTVWIVDTYTKYSDDALLQTEMRCTCLDYTESYPADHDLEAAKAEMVNGLEQYLDNIDPEAFKAVWTLAGVL